MANPSRTIQGIILSGTDRDLPDVLPHGMARYTNFVDMAKGTNARLRSAWDTIMGRTIAVKTLLPSVALDGRQRRRFLREARVTAQLQHPNTVPVYEIGNDPEEGIYFTMKRISGENFLEVIKRLERKDADTEMAFPMRRLLDIAINVAQALAYSHVRGVIHRDIKPENIWVGNFGEVIVLDWGVAKVWGYPDELENLRFDAEHSHSHLAADTERSPAPDSKPAAHPHAAAPAVDSVDESAAANDLSPGLPSHASPQAVVANTAAADGEAANDTDQLRTLTNNGQRLGTPLYMSPEQVRGNDFVDDRTDIFSLGVVIYEMLTQKEPFRGRTVEETFEFIQSWDPPKPSQQAPFRDIPPALDDLVAKAISKVPDQRYQSMLELIQDLESVGEMVKIKP